MKIQHDYQEFLDAQSHIKDSTRKVMIARLANFPSLDKLNVKWFRLRSKKVSPVTLKAEMILAKQLLQFYDMNTSDIGKVKAPRHEGVTVEDLYTREELSEIFKACYDTRDRAIVEVLYESATRASELLSMTFENVHFENSIATAIVKGKTGTREIYLRDSVPALRAYMNVHPVGKGSIWVGNRRERKPKDFEGKRTFKKLTYMGLFQIVEKAVNRANLKRVRDTKKYKRKLLHMFRHTRITELVTLGIRGQSLSKLVGWTKTSNMEGTYVHLSTIDVKNEVASKVFGLETDSEPKPKKLVLAVCPQCKTENDQEARFCVKCNLPLSNDALVSAVREKTLMQSEIDELRRELAEIKSLLTKKLLSND